MVFTILGLSILGIESPVSSETEANYFKQGVIGKSMVPGCAMFSTDSKGRPICWSEGETCDEARAKLYSCMCDKNYENFCPDAGEDPDRV